MSMLYFKIVQKGLDINKSFRNKKALDSQKTQIST